MALGHGPTVVTNGLVLALDAADRNSYSGTGSTWTDLTGRGNTGALTYGPTYSSANGGSIVFDGSNDCVVVNSNASVLSNTAYTKTVWFYITSFATNNNLISGGNNGRHAFSVSISNKLQAGHNSTWNTISSPTPLSLNTWYHAAVTFSTTTGWRLYLNGVLDSTNASTSTVFSAYDVADALFVEVPYGVGYGATTTFLGSGEILIGGYGTGSNGFSGRISNASVYNRVLSATEIQQNFNALAPRFTIVPPIVTSGLVLNLDAGNAGSYSGSGTTWIDISGNNNTGTLVLGPTYSSANGGSIVFDGSNDYVDCGDREIFKIPSQLTLEAFFNISTYVNWSGIIGKSNTSKGVYVMHLSASAQRIRFSYNSVNPWTVNIIDGNYPLTTNQWVHSVITYDGSNVNFYINGSIDKSQNIGSITFDTGAGYPVTLGQDPPGANEFFNGRISNAKIYNRALSAAEVSQNFNALRGRFGI
jgi:hypothetical protein